MRFCLRLIVAVIPFLACPLHAQDVSTVCHASSSFDVTLNSGSLMFDRAAPAPFHVTLQQGHLITDGAPVSLNAEDRDRLTLFERDLRALIPRVRVVGRHGVDVLVAASRDEVAGMHMSAATRSAFDTRLDADAADLKRRIATSQSSHDWTGEAGNQYAQSMASDLLPFLAGDLGQQALNAALSGDLQQAAQLRDRATGLASGWQPRMQQRLQVLRPEIQALCPDIRRLAQLQQGVRDNHGRPLDLLQIEP